jgi:hypothetical protein
MFTISGLIHLGIGYALALYLHDVRPWRSSSSGRNEHDVTSAYLTAPAHQSPVSPIPPAAFAAPPWMPSNAGSPAASIPVDPIEKQVDDRRTEGDQELLAGIEEFRNQLARLKTQHLPVDVAEPAASRGV